MKEKTKTKITPKTGPKVAKESRSHIDTKKLIDPEIVAVLPNLEADEETLKTAVHELEPEVLEALNVRRKLQKKKPTLNVDYIPELERGEDNLSEDDEEF